MHVQMFLSKKSGAFGAAFFPACRGVLCPNVLPGGAHSPWNQLVPCGSKLEVRGGGRRRCCGISTTTVLSNQGNALSKPTIHKLLTSAVPFRNKIKTLSTVSKQVAQENKTIPRSNV